MGTTQADSDVMSFHVTPDAAVLLENIHECAAFLREHGVVDTVPVSGLLCDQFRHAKYAAKRDGLDCDWTVQVEVLIDRAVQVTMIDNHSGYQSVEIRTTTRER